VEDQQQQAVTAGPGKRTGLFRMVWLHMLAEGGRWTTDEIAEAFPNLNRAHANQVLQRLVGTGALHRYGLPVGHPRNGERVKYGITERCFPPQGVSIEDLSRAGFKITEPTPDPS
jgi:hypothetical protein